VGNTVAPPTGISTIYLREIANNFGAPASSPLNVQTQESITSFTGGVAVTTTGGIVGGCSTTTGTLTGLGGSAGSPAVCGNPGPPFGLITTTTCALGAGADVGGSTSTTASAVPEPTSMMLFGSGLLGFAGMIRRKLGK